IRCGKRELFFRRYASALVSHFNAQHSVLLSDAYRSYAASRMAMNVREALLRNAENAEFHFTRQARKIRRKLQSCFDIAPRGKPVNVPVQGGTQADLVQQRGI